MILGPIGLLLYPLTMAISLAILGGGIFFVWGWYEGALTSLAFLICGIGMIALSLLGRPLALLLLGRKRTSATSAAPDGTVHRIARPNGSELYVEQLGPENGPTLVLTHGLSLNHTIWNYVKQSLANHYRLFLWDLPGFGESRGPTSSAYTMEMLAEDLRAVIESTGDGPVVLAGHSLGGMVTLTYCRLHPEELATRVAGLILAQTSYTNPVKTTLFSGLVTALQWPLLQPLCYLMIVASPLIMLMNLQAYLSGMAHILTHMTGFSGTETPEQLEFASRFTIASSPGTTGRAMLAMFDYDASNILQSIPVPVMVIAGDRDIVTLPEANETLHGSIPGSKLSLLKPCAHLGLVEQNERYTEAISGWTSECVAARQCRQSA